MSCFFCDGPKVAPVYNIPHRDYFAAPIGTMTMMPWFTADSVYRLADLIDPYSGRRAKPTGKRNVMLYLVVDYGGEWEDAWERPIVAFENFEDAAKCAVKRKVRQSIWNEGFGYRDYCGSGVTEIDAVIGDSIFDRSGVRDE